MLRIAGTLLAFAYLLVRVSPAELWAACRGVSLASFAAACALECAALGTGALRWRALLRAYGAAHLPSTRRLLGAYLVGLFYNTYVPGGVGGELVRGVATRDSFDEHGATRALSVVVVERIFGLVALLMIVPAGLLIRELPGFDPRHVLLFSLLGLLGAAMVLGAVALGPATARFLPGPFARLAAALPRVHTWSSLLPSLGFSLLTQLLAALSGHALIAALTAVSVVTSVIVLPMAGLAGFFPLSVGGIGTRDVAFVELYTRVGVDSAAAAATALAVFAVQLVVGGVGGLLELARTRRK
jgi:uncharacterized membrane protein YbhN (UPF0104 family)